VADTVGPNGLVLVIGGGAIGRGADQLYQRTRVVGTDIYASENTLLLADGHSLPFSDGVFDAVWIQAVLEHVLDPNIVAAEIHRVLKCDGVVFADTPFMQQVHEGPYDFTRFTLSGHRWLFRNFQEIEAGATSGAGVAAIWAARHLVYALTGSRRISAAIAASLFWLRYLPGKSQRNEDGASGVYFYGKKVSTTIRPHDMVAFYNNRTK
jgi:SAM-dependent methyltransferase